MSTGLNELTAACAKRAGGSQAEQIAQGEAHWYAGYPVPSEPGTVTLRQRDTLKLVFRVEDILEAHRWDERFVISVKAGANLLLSHEQIVKAGPSGCGCGGEETKPRSTARRAGVEDRPGDDWDVWIGNTFGTSCLWTIECFSVSIPLLGPIRICIPTHVLC